MVKISRNTDCCHGDCSTSDATKGAPAQTRRGFTTVVMRDNTSNRERVQDGDQAQQREPANSNGIVDEKKPKDEEKINDHV